MTDVKCRFQKSLPNLVMEEFSFTIEKEDGLHARPAGQLVRLVQEFKSSTTLENKGKFASGKGLFAVMGLGIGCGDEVKVRCEGADEAMAIQDLKKFFKNNLS